MGFLRTKRRIQWGATLGLERQRMVSWRRSGLSALAILALCLTIGGDHSHAKGENQASLRSYHPGRCCVFDLLYVGSICVGILRAMVVAATKGWQLTARSILCLRAFRRKPSFGSQPRLAAKSMAWAYLTNFVKQLQRSFQQIWKRYLGNMI